MFGLASKKIQMRLLERKDLTYDETLKIATTMEFSEKGSESLQVSLAPPTAPVDVVQAGRKQQRKSGPNNRGIRIKGSLITICLIICQFSF